MRPASGAGGYHAERHGYDLVLFASVMLVIIGCFNLIYGIAAIANSHVFVTNAHYVFGGLRSWGWVTLILDALQLLAAAGVMVGNQVARWFGRYVLLWFTRLPPDPAGTFQAGVYNVSLEGHP